MSIQEALIAQLFLIELLGMFVKVNIVLNSPYLGGAERSMILQAKKFSKQKVSFFIPFLKNHSEIRDSVREIKKNFDDVKIILWQYPNLLYSISRSGKISNPLGIMTDFFSLFIHLA